MSKKSFPKNFWANFGKDESDKSLAASIAKNIEGFIGKYPNYKFPDNLGDYCTVYFIDCYESSCPDGCDVECPGSAEGFLPQVQPTRVPGDVKSLIPILPKRGECPKKEKRVFMRAHIGELTEDEVKFIGTKSCISSDTPHPVTLCRFRQATDISLDTPEERLAHYTLLKKFEEVKAADRQGLSRTQRDKITIAMSAAKLAVNLRMTRKRAWGYSLVVGNVPGIPIEQSAPVLAVETQGTNRKTADEKLRDFLMECPECKSLSNVRMAAFIGEKPATVRKTPTWTALSRERRLQKKQNAIWKKLNNDNLPGAERKRLERELGNLKDGEKR